eukprot:CAMPEP_0202877842 /NCGR_PEP_ID=MMETSP1391-20130828/31242_1 /ASSEMBLY_ACC=CAM_ASM_000867 /TAXON_ID=1034604 /ORGANISM="Chlamydomonas leiostraca, Strain SAG 11-49" /LENGTH=228 /DNA_ID=CAMNT_0049559943 /DNA_START=57 /DNA_END=743 /DNA_ORIENTATION=+
MSASLDEVKQAKVDLRNALRAALKQLTKEQMAQESAAIAQQLVHAPFFSSSSTLGIYVHCERLREVDTAPVLSAALDAGKKCFVPVVVDKSSNMKLLHLDCMSSLVAMPPFGIMEPTPAYSDGSPRHDALAEPCTPMDVLVMPGLGFDAAGRRLGRGGGYYDKALSKLREAASSQGHQPPLLVALAFQAQMAECVPVDDHDEPVDVVVTASGVMRCSDRAHAAWPEAA